MQQLWQIYQDLLVILMRKKNWLYTDNNKSNNFKICKFKIQQEMKNKMNNKKLWNRRWIIKEVLCNQQSEVPKEKLK